MLERVMHIIIKTLAYIFILLLFVLLFVRMSGFGRAIFEDRTSHRKQERLYWLWRRRNPFWISLRIWQNRGS